MTKTIYNFVEDWNEGKLAILKQPEINPIVKDFRQSLEEHCDRQLRDYVGLSSVGKAECLLSLYHLGYREPVDHRTGVVFLTGNIWESIIINSMKSYGLNIDNEQATVKFAGYKGHIDCTVNDEIVELKTTSTSHFNSFQKQPTDALGYLSQLACYMEGMGKNGKWLLFHKDSCRLAVVDYPLEFYQEVLERVMSKIRNISNITSREALKSVNIPEPRPEIYKKQETGKYLVPPSLKFSIYWEAFYDTFEKLNNYNKPQRYVAGKKTFEKTLDWLDKFALKLDK